MKDFFRRYKILRPLGAGGMATVYLGMDCGERGFERTVAIKMIHPHLATNADIVTMFVDEGRVAARIHHPNVVATLDVVCEQEDARMGLVMEYIDGYSLREIMQVLHAGHVRFPVESALRIVQDALRGLHAAHELKGPHGAPLDLVHRDVSPPNILVRRDGVTKLGDFGIARTNSRLHWTRPGDIKGKLSYMSFEQLCGGEIDRRADIYSMGIVLWELLTGQRLFVHRDLEAILDGVQRAPHEVNPLVPLPISLACMRALRRNADERYPTAAVFADALEEAAVQSRLGPVVASTVAALCTEVMRLRAEQAASALEASALEEATALEEFECWITPSTLGSQASVPGSARPALVPDPPTLRCAAAPGLRASLTRVGGAARAAGTRGVLAVATAVVFGVISFACFTQVALERSAAAPTGGVRPAPPVVLDRATLGTPR